MTVSALAMRAIVRPARRDASDRLRSPTWSATFCGAILAAAAIAVDAVAVAALLFGTPLPPGLEALAIGVAHATAVLFASGLAGARPGRRWLCVAAVLLVPFAGAVVAAASFATRGRGSLRARRRRSVRPRRKLTIAAIHDLRDRLSPCDALDGGDREQRHAALSSLARRADSEAIALLRRATVARDSDLALSAAQVLDEISERGERRAPGRVRAEVRDGTG